MLILDTNVVAELFRPAPDANVTKWYWSADPEDLFVTAITKAESFLGCVLMPAGRRRQIFEDVLRAFYERSVLTQILPFGSDEAMQFAELVSHHQAIGRPIGEFDAQIAAIARVRGFAVVTRNVRDFADCGIEIINPWESA